MFRKLSKEEMGSILGGVTRKEYCTGLVKLIAANYNDVWDDDQRGAAAGAYIRECKDRNWNE